MVHLQTHIPAARKFASRPGHYHLSLAVDDSEIREAQRLRHTVFSGALGARLSTTLRGHDVDLYDRYCDHLLIRDRDQDAIVGTLRILTPEAARRVGSYAAEQAFDLTRLGFLRPRMAELGRACVHPAHRSAPILSRLWRGAADYLARYGYDYVIGCAGIGLADGGRLAARAHRHLAQRHLAPVEWRTAPWHRLPVETLDDGQPSDLPRPIRVYARLGGRLCGEPAWDPDLNTAQLLMLLPMSL